MIDNYIVNLEKLKAITGFKRDADISKCLKKQGIQCFSGRKGTWTTIGLIEKAGVVSINVPKFEPAIEIL
jgi:hypothetical protein|tara:strand:- start:906 stop:1115 length:210 start_codon:yes stop_codon:yes gene_type:complete